MSFQRKTEAILSKRQTVGVGIIGLGSRGLDCLGRTMAQLGHETGFRIEALCDRNPERMVEARDLLVGAYAEQGIDISPGLYDRGLDLIHAPEVDLVVIASITDSHRAYAVPALHSGKKVYCDKPLAQDATDSIAIVKAESADRNPLIMGFTRRYEAPWRRAHALLQAGTIGDLLMVQIRDVIPYHRYLTAWWRRRAWSGGALNDKGCHLFDVFNWFIESRAVQVHGFGGRSAIRTDPTAPGRCLACDRVCPYRRRSPSGVAAGLAPHAGDSWLCETEEKHMDDVCVYAPGADLYHNGSIHFRYENGAIASFLYSIFGPPAEDQETMELVGTEGRILLTRRTGMLDIVADHGRDHQTIACLGDHAGGSHFGADAELIRELRRFYGGAAPTATARDGLEATRMVMAAFRSMDGGGVAVDMDDIPDLSL
jgi:predicted dehydrogenase